MTLAPPPALCHVLVADADHGSRTRATRLLRQAGFQVEVVDSGPGLLARVGAGFRAVVLLDANLRDARGALLLPALRRQAPEAPIVMLTGRGTADLALTALEDGAFDFLDKAGLNERLVGIVRRAAESTEPVRAPLPGPLEGDAFKHIITRSRQMARVLQALRPALASRVPVLIRGESGTGKELIARALHTGGPRASGPYVAVNCAGIPENLLEAELFGYEKGAFTGAGTRKLGRFDLAKGGTLFLDEIGDMPPALQAKLLRVLQQGEYQRLGGVETLQADVRIVSATNLNIENAVEHDAFREDLYYRLAVFTVDLPPLRERAGDVALLAAHFVEKAAAREAREAREIDPLAMELLAGYSFPGNVRQLENVLSHAVVVTQGPTITMTSLPTGFLKAVGLERRLQAPAVQVADGPFLTLNELERRQVEAAMRRTEGNKAHAARLLGVSRMTLYRKLAEHGIT